MKLIYPAVFYEGEDGYTVEFPDLPGCVTQGDTLEEAMEMAVDAASGWILIMIEDGEDIPSPSRQLNLSDYEGAAFSNLIMLDMEEYAKQYGEKAVKKTLTIPRWLNTLSERKNINFSQVLQTGLKIELGLDYNNNREQDSITTTVNDIAGILNEKLDVIVSKMDNFEENSSAETTASPTYMMYIPAFNY